MGGAAGPGPQDPTGAAGTRRPWRGRHVVLGVAGGIAAYKVVQLARDLTLYGATVDVILTRSAREFLGPITFEALTGRPVHTDLIERGHALEHIRLARQADVVCVAPATADLIARAAQGRADDLLTAVLLATRAPVLLCPAMNDAMWAHPQTQANSEHVRSTLGYRIVGPAEGALAWGEGRGPGRMLEAAHILEHIGRALAGGGAFAGRSVLVTAGPTREAVDAVRVLTNRSSGRMGFALAAAAWRRGANVTLIAGPTSSEPPFGPALVRVETAAQMAERVRAALATADVLVMAAAVADFKPVSPVATKLKRRDGAPAIELEPATDVLAGTLDARPAGLVAVGFALETGDDRDEAKRKLDAKGLDMIVLNRADEPGSGFDVDTNHVVLIERGGRETDVPLQPKTEVAEIILDHVEARLTR
jgi:phosphopantothenoylcysteine decarboxylase/phosphopantothenate--cysteine ligase